MIRYDRYPGDYLRDTLTLTPAQDGMYGRLIDYYYTTEKPIPEEDAESVTRCRNDEDRAITQWVLRRFFSLTPVGWQHGRIDAEIEKARPRIEAARNNGLRGGRPKTKPTGFPLGNPQGTQIESSPSPSPSLEQEQEQKKEQVASPSAQPTRAKEDRATRLPADWTLPDDWRAWAEAERSDIDPATEAAKFRDHWRSQPGVKGRRTDWLATWRNWIRNSWANSRAGPSAPAKKPTAADSFAGKRYEGTPLNELPESIRARVEAEINAG